MWFRTYIIVCVLAIPLVMQGQVASTNMDNQSLRIAFKEIDVYYVLDFHGFLSLGFYPQGRYREEESFTSVDDQSTVPSQFFASGGSSILGVMIGRGIGLGIGGSYESFAEPRYEAWSVFLDLRFFGKAKPNTNLLYLGLMIGTTNQGSLMGFNIGKLIHLSPGHYIDVGFQMKWNGYTIPLVRDFAPYDFGTGYSYASIGFTLGYYYLGDVW